MTKNTLTLLLTCTLLAQAAPSAAVAYCALRDPVSTIYDFFPEASSYRSNVQTVGRKAREAVTSQLPFEMHFNELGRHTLYVALNESTRIGFVHARSESGEWGITEYAWAITTDLEIQGVKVQRSRDPGIRKLSSDKLSGYVAGKNLATLTAERNIALKERDTLKASILTSAMKALIITETVWETEFSVMPPEDLYSKHVPDATNISRIQILYDPTTLKNLTKVGLSESPAFERSSLIGYRLSGPDNQLIALAVRAPNSVVSPSETLWWLVDSDGAILRITADSKTQPNLEVFEPLLGRKPNAASDCSSLVELAALEVSTLTRRHATGI